MHSPNPSAFAFLPLCLYRVRSGKKDSKKFVKGIYLLLCFNFTLYGAACKPKLAVNKVRLSLLQMSSKTVAFFS